MLVGVIEGVSPAWGVRVVRATVPANGEVAVTVIVEVVLVPGIACGAFVGLRVIRKLFTVLSKFATRTNDIGTGLVVPSEMLTQIGLRLEGEQPVAKSMVVGTEVVVSTLKTAVNNRPLAGCEVNDATTLNSKVSGWFRGLVLQDPTAATPAIHLDKTIFVPGKNDPVRSASAGCSTVSLTLRAMSNPSRDGEFLRYTGILS